MYTQTSPIWNFHIRYSSGAEDHIAVVALTIEDANAKLHEYFVGFSFEILESAQSGIVLA